MVGSLEKQAPTGSLLACLSPQCEYQRGWVDRRVRFDEIDRGTTTAFDSRELGFKDRFARETVCRRGHTPLGLSECHCWIGPGKSWGHADAMMRDA